MFRRNNEKLPLAVIIHYNWHISLLFAVLFGHTVFNKNANLFMCNSFQQTLLAPTYLCWLATEIPRLSIGKRGIQCYKLADLAAFLLLSCFPQFFTVVYLGFLQEIILYLDLALGGLMLAMIVTEIALTWRCLKSLTTRKNDATPDETQELIVM